MDFAGKGVEKSLVCETSNKKVKEQNSEETDLKNHTICSGKQLTSTLAPVICSVMCPSTTIEKPEKEEVESEKSGEAAEEEEEECKTPTAEEFRIPPPLKCPPAPKPNRLRPFFTGNQQ